MLKVIDLSKLLQALVNRERIASNQNALMVFLPEVDEVILKRCSPQYFKKLTIFPDCQDLEDMLGLFCEPYQKTFPYATLLASQKGLNLCKSYCLLSPIQVTLDAHRAYVTDIWPLSEPMIQGLGRGLASFFQDEGLILHSPTPYGWLVEYPSDYVLKAIPLSKMKGQSLGERLPEGQNGYWQRLLTSLQLWLHQHPFNQCQEQSIDSFWIWGEGELNSQTQPLNVELYTNDEWVKTFFKDYFVKIYPLSSLDLNRISASTRFIWPGDVFQSEDLIRLMNKIVDSKQPLLVSRPIPGHYEEPRYGIYFYHRSCLNYLWELLKFK